jgi:tRNA G18 (ribose-2'-O)-methylase SpoU
VVEDPEDPRLELYRDLKDPAGRNRLDGGQPVFVVEGKFAVDRLLVSRYTVRSLLVDEHNLTVAADVVAATQALGATVYVGSRALVAATVGFALHRGVVAVAQRPPPTAPDQVLAGAVASARSRRPVLIAVLEGLNDHENIGALFRNAAAFGVAGILLDPTCADPLYRRSIRVSVGHVLLMPFARLTPWPSGLQHVRDAGFVVAALSPRPATDASLPAVSLTELEARVARSAHHVGVAVLLGAEGPGLSDVSRAASDVVVGIPMADGVDSLNVATAAAVAFHALAGR